MVAMCDVIHNSSVDLRHDLLLNPLGIEPFERIHRLAVDKDLEMEVVAASETRGSAPWTPSYDPPERGIVPRNEVITAPHYH
jgi:hypothetical protein